MNGVRTGFVWDNGNIIETTDGNGNPTGIYKYGLGRVSDNKGNYYIYNAHGDVTGLTDSAGNVVREYEYGAFGMEVSKDSNDTNPFRYCGEYYDNETEGIYLRARNYDPGTGRFTSEDPHWTVDNMIYGDKDTKIPDIKSIMQSSNRYVYCINNPINNIDYSGEFAVGIPLAAVAEISPELLATAITGLGYIGYKIFDGIVYIFTDDNEEIIKNSFEVVNESFNILKKVDEVKVKEDINKVLNGAEKGRETKGKSKQWNKKGNYNDALKDYNSLNPKNSNDINTKYGSGKVGELADGTKVVVRPGCSDGVDTPTLEIQEKNGNRIKVRYKN